MTVLFALQEGIPFAADPTPVGGRAMATAIIVVALLAALAWYLRQRLPAARQRQAITIETAVSLGERRSLVIVTVENRRLLLGLTPQQVSLVSELRVAVPAPPAPSFQETLQASVDAGGQRP